MVKLNIFIYSKFPTFDVSVTTFEQRKNCEAFGGHAFAKWFQLGLVLLGGDFGPSPESFLLVGFRLHPPLQGGCGFGPRASTPLPGVERKMVEDRVFHNLLC